MSDEKSFVVIPFQRVGTYIGPHQMLVLDNPKQAQALASELSKKYPGVALIEKSVDEDTGADIETLIAHSGAVPENITQSANWTIPLH